MIRTLHRRLTALFTAITGAVLWGCLLVTLWLAAGQARTAHDELVRQCLWQLSGQVSVNGFVRSSDLNAAEQQFGGFVFVQDGSSVMNLGATAALRTAREPIWRQADAALGDGSESVRFSAADGTPCRASRQTLYAGNCPLTLTVVEDLTALQARLFRLALCYAAIAAAGTAALGVLNHRLLRRALRPVEESFRRQKEFVAAAGHELRTPLAVLRGALEVLARRAEPTPETAELTHAAESEADRMAHLLGELLTLAGQDAPGQPLPLAPLAPDAFCLQFFETYRHYAAAQGHPLRLRIADADFPDIWANAERLTQICAAFVANGIAHTPPGTELLLSCTMPAPDTAELSLADRGAGIPDAEKEKIFAPFYTADPARAKGHAGLGLSIAQTLARQQNAALGVRDTQGGGATFYVRFSAGAQNRPAAR